MKISTSFLVSLFCLFYFNLANATIEVVAAENVYGDVAKQLGGPYVAVTSILNNPAVDPHLFSITPKTAKIISNANIIIYNGADYDPWMLSTLNIEGQKKRSVIDVSSLMHIKSGENPHIWYKPSTIPTFAKTFVNHLSKIDPTHQNYFNEQLKKFNYDYQTILSTVNHLKKAYQNTPVIATEPVFGYMADAIGLKMHGLEFQINLMNDVPPSVSEIKSFEDDLKQHQVKVLIYNNQVSNPTTERMLSIAKNEKIPVVGVNEMMFSNTHFIEWMMNQLSELERAMPKSQGK